MTGRPRKYDRTSVCGQCGQTFERKYAGKPKGDVLLCSTECFTAYHGERNRTTNRANKPGGLTAEERAKISTARRSMGEGKTYRREDGRHVHRTVAEAVLGRDLTPGEVVHHIDLDRRNNHPDNLAVLPSQAEHARIHMLMKHQHLTGGDLIVLGLLTPLSAHRA